MRPSVLLIGALALLLPLQMLAASSASSSSAPATLYDRIKGEVEEEMGTDKVEPEIATYVQAVLKKKGEDISLDDVTYAMKNQTWSLCAPSATGALKGTLIGCDDLAEEIRTLVINEERIRKLGRGLELTATSYELPLSDLPGKSQQMSSDLQGIVSIWRAGTGSVTTAATSGATIRTQTIADAKISAPLQELADALNALDTEQRTAAVWRYQYGVRLIRNERAPQFPAPYEDAFSGPGTERQYLFKQWPDVEAALKKIWDVIRKEPMSPALQSSEVAQFVFPQALIKNTLPDNIILWGRVGTGATSMFGDVGLQWAVPLEPVLPSLMDSAHKPILGGTYPPAPEVPYNSVMEPIDGSSLCSDPVELRGYLCRTVTPAAGQTCPDDPAHPTDPTKINLVTCLDKTTIRTTMAGPDVCRDTDIRDPLPFDPVHECKIAFTCGINCGAAFGGTAVDAVTKNKDANGVIKICIDANKTGKGTSDLIYHELVHAYQFCTLPPAQDPYVGTREQRTATCCELEGGGYRAQCDMAEEDGAFQGNPVFKDPATGKDYIDPVTGKTLPLNAETCAEAETNLACGPDGYNHLDGCYQSRTYPAGFINALAARFNGIPKNLPLTCAAATNPKTMDPRVRDLMDAIENRRDVCGPGQKEVFKNTIGNNMCYVGQCIEESTEIHRVTGAQSPATTGDQAYPWNDPQNGVPLGNTLVNAPIATAQLPVYQPLMIVQQLETEICQLQGLPPLTPSILCTYNPAKNIQNPINDYIGEAQSFLKGEEAQANATDNVLSLSLALGSRLGTSMYATELTSISRSLSDILTMAVRLFKEITTIDFPTQMCPTDNTLPAAVSSSSASS